MERVKYENYEQTQSTINRPQPESAANTLGSMVLSFIVFESMFAGLGSLGGSSVLGSSDAFAHTTAEIAGVNNLASAGYEKASIDI